MFSLMIPMVKSNINILHSVKVGDIVELSLLGGRFVDTGKVVEIIPFGEHNDILVESHTVKPGERLCFSERQVSSIISRACEQDSLSAIIDEITRG